MASPLIKRALLLSQLLDHLYPNPPIPLDHTDSFTLLVAVVLSAQTTDGKVNAVTPELFRRAPTCSELAKMPYDELLEIVRSVGLAPTKTKNLLGLANKLVSDFNGEVPGTFKELESLPGVGHKTASVVMSQAFGHLAFPVDTHIHRLAVRFGFSKEKSSVAEVEADLKALFPQDSWHRLHLQLIYFGREYCQAKNHMPKRCPACSWVKKKTIPDRLEEIKLEPSPKKASKNIILYSERKEEIAVALQFSKTEKGKEVVHGVKEVGRESKSSREAKRGAKNKASRPLAAQQVQKRRRRKSKSA